MYGTKSRQCTLNDHDIREHVDWMTRYADEAWMELEKRVGGILPKVKAHQRIIAKSQTNFNALEEVVRQIQRTHHAEIQTLKRNFLRLNEKSSEFYQDFRDMKIDVRLLKQNFTGFNSSFQLGIKGLQSKDVQIDKNINAINREIDSFKDKFEYFSHEINTLSANFQAASKNIKQLTQETHQKNNAEIEELKKYLCKGSEIYKKQENIDQRIVEMRDSLIKTINDDISKTQQQIQKCSTDIYQINKNIDKADQEITVNKRQIQRINDKMTQNNETIRKQINEGKNSFQVQKEDLFFNFDKLKKQMKESEAFRSSYSKQSMILKKELKNYQAQTGEKMKVLEEEMRISKQEKKKTIEDLKERMEVFQNKVGDLVEKNKGIQQPKEVTEAREKKLAQEYEKIVDKTTPFAHRFLIQTNTITYNEQYDGWYQILLNVVIGRKKPFVLHVHIVHTEIGNMQIGVLDRRTRRKAKESSVSSNSVGYEGYYCQLGFQHKGEYSQKKIGVRLKTGMDVRMEVQLDKGLITFTIAGNSFQQACDILSEPHREIVPCFHMLKKGQSVRWRIE